VKDSPVSFHVSVAVVPVTFWHVSEGSEAPSAFLRTLCVALESVQSTWMTSGSFAVPLVVQAVAHGQLLGVLAVVIEHQTAHDDAEARDGKDYAQVPLDAALRPQRRDRSVGNRSLLREAGRAGLLGVTRLLGVPLRRRPVRSLALGRLSVGLLALGERVLALGRRSSHLGVPLERKRVA
jgi:hypothetical protein